MVDVNAATQSIVDGLNAAWNRVSGERFAAHCLPGRPAVTAVHQPIFNGAFEGSTLAFLLGQLRLISADAVFAILPAELHVPGSYVKVSPHTIASALVVYEISYSLVANFQNTEREATEPTSRPSLDTFRKINIVEA